MTELPVLRCFRGGRKVVKVSANFVVDPDELDEAAGRLEKVLSDDLSPVFSGTNIAVGHAGLASAMSTFATRWATARTYAREEVTTGAQGLRDSAALYRAGDAEADAGFDDGDW